MTITKLIALVLIVGGVLGLVYGGFTYTSDSHNADLGPVELSVQEKDHFHIPVWLGVGLIAIGSLLLMAKTRTV